jgi:hypothetical protein
MTTSNRRHSPAGNDVSILRRRLVYAHMRLVGPYQHSNFIGYWHYSRGSVHTDDRILYSS